MRQKWKRIKIFYLFCFCFYRVDAALAPLGSEIVIAMRKKMMITLNVFFLDYDMIHKTIALQIPFKF